MNRYQEDSAGSQTYQLVLIEETSGNFSRFSPEAKETKGEYKKQDCRGQNGQKSILEYQGEIEGTWLSGAKRTGGVISGRMI